MKKHLYIIAVLFSMLMIAGCNPEDDTKSLWGPDSILPDSSQHTLTSLEILNTGTEYIEGITTLKAIGTNFSQNYQNMKIWASLTKAFLASPDAFNYKTTEFQFKLPLVYDPFKEADKVDTITLKLEKVGVSRFAIKKIEGAIRGILVPIAFPDVDKPVASITLDKNDNIYFCITQSNVSKGVFKYDVTKNEYAEFARFSGQFTGLKYGPGDTVYAAGLNYIVSFDGKNVTKINQIKSVSTVTDFDFDKNLNIWTVAKTSKIITLLTRASKYKTNVNFTINDADIYEMRSCKYLELNGKAYLYVGGADKNGVEKVVRFEISNNTLNTTPEVMFQSPTGTGQVKVNAIVLSKNGDIYIGSNNTVPLVWVKTNGTYEYMLYYNNLTKSCVIDPNIVAIAGGGVNKKYIYLIRATPEGKTTPKQTIFKVYTGIETAPYYGRGDN